MTTTQNVTKSDTPVAFVRVIALRGSGKPDIYWHGTIDDPSWDTLHATRHAIARRRRIDPMRVDIYNVRMPNGEYVGGFDSHDGCDTCKWDQARY